MSNSNPEPCGFLNILKPPGMTSHDVVDAVRRHFPRGFKVGHLGTLDPAASGVLPIAVGAATRWISLLPPARKQYVAELTLGLESDTLDGEGEVYAGGSIPSDLDQRLPALLSHWRGTVMQVPPQVSAIKVGGKRSYERARAGAEFTLDARPATYHNVELLRRNGPRLWLRVDCGPGTYIRALARDLGQELGCGKLLSALLRTRSGRFSQPTAILMEELPDWPRYLLALSWPWLEQPALGADWADCLRDDEPRWMQSEGLAGVVGRAEGQPALLRRA